MKHILIKQFICNEDGQAMTEYVLATILITVIFIASMNKMSDAIKNVFSRTIDKLSVLINSGSIGNLGLGS